MCDKTVLLLASKTPFLSSAFDSLIIICLSMNPFEFIILGVHWASCIGQYLSNLKSFQQVLLQMFLLFLPLSSPSETWIMHICLLDISLSSLILYSANSNLLLNLSSNFSVSVIVIFNSKISLGSFL